MAKGKDCRQRKLTAWNVYQRQVYADMLSKHGKEAAFKMTAERLKTEESKKEYKAQKASLAKLAAEENKTIKICPKSLETGYVRDPATGRKRSIAILPPKVAARLGVHRKTGKEDGKPRWLYLVTNNGARVYSGSKDGPSTRQLKRAYWSKLSPDQMRRSSNPRVCGAGKRKETPEEAQARKKKDGLKRAVRKCVKEKPKRKLVKDKDTIKAKAMKRTNDLVKKLSQPQIKKEPSSKMLAEVSKATTQATQQYLDL